MKKTIAALALTLLLPVALYAQDTKQAPKLTTFQEKLSYATGLDVGGYFKEMGEEIQLENLTRGITDAYTGKQPAMTKEEVGQVLQEFSEKMQAKQAAQLSALQEKNAAAGKAYLDGNRKKKGVVETKSGLQYEVLLKGDGPKPGPDDVVKFNYTGSFINGKEFDSSAKRGAPPTMPVSQLIPGWTEALQLMPVGSKYRLVVPADLAYGESGLPPVIEPNSVLLFDVELLGIEPPKKADAPTTPAK
ncbi:MAG: FKBP-type peptidyl-prolyl cis-trans isomerase [Desulfobulbaceae bacterium]|jgi:peptidylprolyl isomerase/FKBP-type peptidyl-prolyl cis-trans isomerase FklB|nr:FKBP-type peptidyl-prolyl cis-trans isomerase [Desulfobulbaceae bacterium]